MVCIELNNITYKYPLSDENAVENLTCKFEEGKFYGIIGENGGGKTTLCNIIRGLIPNFYKGDLTGQVKVLGKDISEWKLSELSVKIGYVFQNPDEQIFNPDVRSEVSYMPKHLKMEDEEVIRRIRWAMELTGVRQYQKINPLDMPYPIRKFVTIAAVIAMEPRYVILDEPTAGQDLKGIKILEKLLDELQQRGISVITITHDMEFVANNFERVIAMANKEIIADNNAKEIFWNQDILDESKIKKPQIAEVAERLGIAGNILYMDELIGQIR
mgnify:FL=1